MKKLLLLLILILVIAGCALPSQTEMLKQNQRDAEFINKVIPEYIDNTPDKFATKKEHLKEYLKNHLERAKKINKSFKISNISKK